MAVKEVPSDHDFFDPAYVKKWTASIVRYRPERQQLFKVFIAEAARIQKDQLSVLELGCGPGFLAEQLQPPSALLFSARAEIEGQT